MTEPAHGRRRNRWLVVGALAIAAAAFLAITVGGIGDNLVYYWNPTELHAAGNKAYGATIRLGGLVEKGSVRYSATDSSLQFRVTDQKKSVPVRSTGVPPQMFREGIGVVIEGTMQRGGYFESSRLMISHNNEYRAPREGETVDTKELIRTTDGLEGPEGNR